MIEKRFISQKMKEVLVQEFVAESMRRAGVSHTRMFKTPLGEKIVVYATKPGMVVGKKGESIKNLTRVLKKRFNLENPQIELSDVSNPNLDPQIISERIASSLERFGTSKFKGIGHKTMGDVMGAGALGVEIKVSGKIPSARAKSWRFYQGYLKKCGDIAISGVRTAYAAAQLKTGTVGIQVRIMPPDIKLPDDIEILKQKEEIVEEIAEPGSASKEEPAADAAEAKESKENKEAKPKRTRKKKQDEAQK
ncbi:30S ribosomal protein S3 [Candidatus Woesearchaeota archaeon]|nr:30S ribosomal protein S3 [Candidatus Woesearchaeota archaeon]